MKKRDGNISAQDNIIFGDSNIRVSFFISTILSSILGLYATIMPKLCHTLMNLRQMK
jgi:hypothetical protein